MDFAARLVDLRITMAMATKVPPRKRVMPVLIDEPCAANCCSTNGQTAGGETFMVMPMGT